MTRKRFKNLMMAKGYSRNQANSLCLLINVYKDYDTLYKEYDGFMINAPGCLSGFAKYANDAINNFCKAIDEFCNNTVPEFIESLKNAN